MLAFFKTIYSILGILAIGFLIYMIIDFQTEFFYTLIIFLIWMIASYIYVVRYNKTKSRLFIALINILVSAA